MRSNPYKHIHRAGGKRSGLETQVAADLALCNVEFKGEKEIAAIEYSELRPKKYHPDFELDNGVIIECKGWFKPADRSKHLCIKYQHPEKDIRFVFSNPNAKLSKHSLTTYADWCVKHGFMFAAKFVPTLWMEEPRKGQ